MITAKPEMSPEYMRSLSPEINKELIAELCERIIWSGGGAEASLREEDMLKEERKEDGFAEVTRPAGPRTNPTKTSSIQYIVYVSVNTRKRACLHAVPK